jgi:hypothetical protein
MPTWLSPVAKPVTISSEEAALSEEVFEEDIEVKVVTFTFFLAVTFILVAVTLILPVAVTLILPVTVTLILPVAVTFIIPDACTG